MAGMVLDYTAHDWDEIPAQLMTEALTYKIVTTSGGGHPYQLYNIPAAFDIETSSWEENGEKKACLVCWQLGINGRAYMGRTWDDLKDALDLIKAGLGLSDSLRLPIYVHNLGYEFQWLRKQLDGAWEVFAGDSRDPYKAAIDGFEFRDSLILTNLSLEATADTELHQYTVRKQHGWDYSKIRHSKTPLTQDEINYAIFDVLVVMALIAEYMDREPGRNISKIPMTRTGYVRRECRSACRKDPTYKQLMASLKIDADEYMKLKMAYQGGFTHANSNKVNKTLETVGSYDFTSSYPAVMVMEEFPHGKAGYALPKDAAQFKQWIKQYCCLIHVTLYDVKDAIKWEHIISKSKCIIVDNAVVDNGRIVSADKLEIWITELDYKLISRFYTYSRITIHEMIRYYKRHLPKPIIDVLLKYYVQKTTYKDVTGKEVEYAIAKAMCNAIYGMMVQDVVRDDVTYYGDWEKKDGNPAEQVDAYNKSRSRFTYYPWGVWITAYARYNLICGIAACKKNYNYSDTDSIKFDLDGSDHFLEYVEKYNKLVDQKMAAAMAYYGYPADHWKPKDIKGIEHPLGYWDVEPTYAKFKTLGAKRYLGFYDVLKGKTNVLRATIAGANKKMASKYLDTFQDPFSAFSDQLVIPASHSGRMVATYIDDPQCGLVTDYNGFTAYYEEQSSINLSPSEYTLGLGQEFLAFLLTNHSGKDIILAG